jgi:hypothetical protein
VLKDIYMPDEALITEIENVFAEIIDLGGQNEDSKIVPNLTVQDASPTNLDGWLIVSDDRDGDNILARKVGSVVYADNDLVNVMFSNNGIWEIVPSTSTDIFYDKGQVGIGTATPGEALDVAGNITLDADIIHRGDTNTNISFTDDDIELTVGGLSMLKLTETAQDLILTETAQDLITLGPGSGDVDINFNGDMFLRGSNATFGINTSTTAFTEEGSAAPAQLYLLRTNAAGFRGAVYSTESDTAGRNAQNAFIRSRVGPAAVQDADRLGDFFFSGHDGTDYNRSARFGAIVDGAVSANTVPTALDFSTSETNSGGLTTRLYIAPDGDVGIGITGPTAQLHVDQASATAAQPVLYLDQADISEEMIEFNTTIGVGNAIEAVGAKSLTTTHFIKVTLPGALTRYFPVGTIA